MHFTRPGRRVLVVGAIAVAVVAAALTWWLRRPEEATAATITSTVSLQSFKETVSATGTIAPASQADLSFSVSGTVTAVYVAVGDAVAKGQVLAAVDDTLLASQVTAKQSALTAAKAKLAEDSDASSAQLAADKASVAQAQSALAEAKESLAAAKLTASIDGTVAALDLEVGDVVGSGGGAGAQDASSAAQVTLVTPKAFVVDAQVATSDISDVTPGLQAQITPTGSSEIVYGTVATVGKVATAQSNGAATFPVTVAVTGEQEGLYSGTSATVEIIVKQVDDVLAVPAQAIHQEDDETFVYRLVDGKRTKTPVVLGTTYGQQTEVTEGLAEGDEVELATFQRQARGGSSPDGDQGGEQGGFPGGGFGGGVEGGRPPVGDGGPSSFQGAP